MQRAREAPDAVLSTPGHPSAEKGSPSKGLHPCIGACRAAMGGVRFPALAGGERASFSLLWESMHYSTPKLRTRWRGG